MAKYKLKTFKGKKVLEPRRYKSQKVLKVLKPVNNRMSVKRDKKYKALPPGRRVSRWGHKYTETRSNRSDKKGKLI